MSKKVTVQSSGKSFLVEDQESILDAALRQNITFVYSCRDGLCGSCKSKVLSGEVYYPKNELPEALDEAQKTQGWNLLCQARAGTDLVIEAEELPTVEGLSIKKLPCRLVKMEKYAHDVMGLFLKIPQNHEFLFLAGQYINILLKDGRHRSYSIANPPHKSELIEIHIRHVPNGAFSDLVFSELKEKAILRFQGPMGTFFLRENQDHHPLIFIAGGTGFAPIKGLVEHLLSTAKDQEIHLYWGVQAKRDIYLPELPEQWQQQFSNFKYSIVLSAPGPEDKWHGRTGFVTQAIVEDFTDLSQTEIYAAGPPAMIESGKNLFFPKGLAENRYHFDSFEFAKE